MIKANFGHGIPFVLIALAPAFLPLGCGQAEFQGSTTTRQRTANAVANSSGPSGTTDKSAEFVSVGVSYEQEEALSLVGNALVSYKAELVGGNDCWGTQASPFSDSTAAPKLKVRKGAVQCFVNFLELSIQDGAAVIFKNASGLRSDNKVTVDFANSDGSSTIAIRSLANLTTNSDSTVSLAGRASKVETVPIAATSEELQVSAAGDIVAYPNVAVTKGPFLFKNVVRAILNCAVNSPKQAAACTPSVVAQGSGIAAPQRIADMDAAVAILKGQTANTFPASMTQANLDSLFATKKIGNELQGLSEISAPIITASPLAVEFGGMTLPTVAAGNKAVLIVRYFEVVAPSTAKTYTYKVFSLSL